MFFAKPLQRSNLCASHRQRRWLTHGELSWAAVCFSKCSERNANLFHLFGFICMVVGCVLSVVVLYMVFFDQEAIAEIIQSFVASVDGRFQQPLITSSAEHTHERCDAPGRVVAAAIIDRADAQTGRQAAHLCTAGTTYRLRSRGLSMAASVGGSPTGGSAPGLRLRFASELSDSLTAPTVRVAKSMILAPGQERLPATLAQTIVQHMRRRPNRPDDRRLQGEHRWSLFEAPLLTLLNSLKPRP